MVMVSARLTRRWRFSYRHDIDERGHRGLARRCVAVRRCAVLKVAEGERNFLASTMGLASRLAMTGLVGTGLSPQGPMSGPTAMTGRSMARLYLFNSRVR